MSLKRKIPFFGETNCEAKTKKGKKCVKNAYYQQNSKFYCGQHSKKGKRKELKKDPDEKEKKEKMLQDHQQYLEIMAKENYSKNAKGSIIGHKMKMMKSVPLKPGFLNVFPNRKHENRKDGFGCSNLSPMMLGPVNHNEPGVPVALNIENFHQFSKVFKCELADDGSILQTFFEYRDKAYKDKIAHRHKFSRALLKTMNSNVNIPEYSVHVKSDKKLQKISYLESRWFYCVWYEHLAKKTEQFKKLLNIYENGTNLCVCGYDSYDPEGLDSDSLYQHYLDTSRPFGHELVLISLLVLNDRVDQYPWKRYENSRGDFYSKFYKPI